MFTAVTTTKLKQSCSGRSGSGHSADQAMANSVSVDIDDVTVLFPFKPYDCQLDYMKKVIASLKGSKNALLESPTGTGKTLSLLCSSLAWLTTVKAKMQLNRQLSYTSETPAAPGPPSSALFLEGLEKGLTEGAGDWDKGSRPPKILYSSRTHSQIAQVVSELKRTVYKPKICVLGSREQLCINPDVMKEQNQAAKIHMCRAKVAAKTCSYYNNFDTKFKNMTTMTDDTSTDIMDIEALVSEGRKNYICPYYMSKERAEGADIIFMPYNYLLDNKSRGANAIDVSGNVVIFDEGHNIEKICEESSSVELTSYDVSTCMEEISALMQTTLETEKSTGDNLDADFTPEDLAKLKAIFINLETQLDGFELKDDFGVTHPGGYIYSLFQSLGVVNQDHSSVIELALDKICRYLGGESNDFAKKGLSLQKFSDFLKVIYPGRENAPSSAVQMERNADHYKVHVSRVPDKRSTKQSDVWCTGNRSNAKKSLRKLSYWCFSPGFSMQRFRDKGVRSIILTSGTLSPLHSFKAQMRIEFPLTLESPHVIQKHQFWVGIVPEGPCGTTLSSAYDNRDSERYLQAVGNAIANYARVTPKGVLVFFPSYPMMEKTVNSWKSTGTWMRILRYKQILVEPRNKKDFEETMKTYYEKIDDPALHGAIYCAVCRGKVSEGLDFADANGRAVIITGLPYPPKNDPRVVLKMKYLDDPAMKQPDGLKLSGWQWYQQEASRAVNQAIGRVIRHRNDYGAILLLDKRFAWESNKAQLPHWVRPYVQTFKKFGPSLKGLMDFFKLNESAGAAASKPAPDVMATDHETGSGRVSASFTSCVTSRGPVPRQRPVTQSASSVDCHLPGLQGTQQSRHVTTSTNQEPRTKRRCVAPTADIRDIFNMAAAPVGTFTGLVDNKDVITDDKDDDSYTEASKPLKRKRIVIKPKSSTTTNSEEGRSVGGTSSLNGENGDLSQTPATARGSVTPGENMKRECGPLTPSLRGNQPPTNSNPATRVQSQKWGARDFHQLVKKITTKEKIGMFSTALSAYHRNSGEFEELVAVLSDVFLTDDGRHSLFRYMYNFMHQKHKQKYSQLCETLTGKPINKQTLADDSLAMSKMNC